MIFEGLADHFVVELTGGDPPNSTQSLTPVELDYWIAEASKVWLNGSYQHDEWFFGSTPAVPRWTGYAVGYELVRRYLATHPDARPSTLTAVPAALLTP